MATNEKRDPDLARKMYGDSELIFSESLRMGSLVDVSSIDPTSGNILRENKCYCPECQKIVQTKLVAENPDNANDNLYECEECGYTDLKRNGDNMNRGSNRSNFHTIDRFTQYFPRSLNVYLSEKNGRNTRCVYSLLADRVTYTNVDEDVKIEPIRSIIDVNGQSNSVQQVMFDAEGNSFGFRHLPNRLNPNYHYTAFLHRPQMVVDSIDPLFRPCISVERNGKYETTNTHGINSTGFDRFNLTHLAENAVYSHLAQKFGLSDDSMMDIADKRALIYMSVLYPGVMEREIKEMDTNQEFAAARGEGLSEEEFGKFKVEKLLGIRDTIALMDHNLGVDLSRLKSAEEVTAYLRSIIFAESPKIELPKLMVDVKKSKMLDDGYNGKKLRKMYNTDPYATASNVRTALKMNVRDVNHLNLLLSTLDKDCDSAHMSGVLHPIETRDQMRLVRSMQKQRDIARVITDIYMADDKGKDGFQYFQDSAKMYNDLMNNKHSHLITDKEHIPMVKYLDFLHKIEDYVETEEKIDAYIASDEAPDWGDRTKSNLMSMAESIERYKKSGLWDEMYFTTRDGKPLFDRPLDEVFTEKAKQKIIANPENNLTEDSPIDEIKAKWVNHGLHAELVNMLQTSVGRDKSRKNVRYQWDSELRERVEKDYGDYRFRLAKDSNDLIICGRKSNLDVCIGGAGYDEAVKRGSSAIVMMMDKKGDYFAAIEMSPDCKRFYQFKTYQNGPCYGPAVPIARQWIKDIGADPSGCHDIKLFNEEMMSYNGRSWSVRDDVLEDEKADKDIPLAVLYKGSKLADELSNKMVEEKLREAELKAAQDEVDVSVEPDIEF